MLSHTTPPPLLFIVILLTMASSFNVALAGARTNGGRKLAGDSPLTAKASLILYWKKRVSNGLPKPSFLLNKVSPLDAVQLANLSKLANQDAYGRPSYYESTEPGGSVGRTGLIPSWLEPPKYFREKMLKTGTVMPMPDIKDKTPQRWFLSREILKKYPFSTSKIDELKKIFHAGDDPGMAVILEHALSDCEKAPSHGETKQCVGSAEDMIDFATSALGRNVVVRTAENTRGSGGDIMVGTVKRINGGQVTKPVSCHQILYPYLLYYCHSVPKIRVYEFDILDPKSKDQINHGVAICHLDTSGWRPNDEAIVELGSGPGKIEVCHWILENDVLWTSAE